MFSPVRPGDRNDSLQCDGHDAPGAQLRPPEIQVLTEPAERETHVPQVKLQPYVWGQYIHSENTHKENHRVYQWEHSQVHTGTRVPRLPVSHGNQNETVAKET